MLCYCPVVFPAVLSYCHMVFVHYLILSYSITSYATLSYLSTPPFLSIYLSIYQSIYLSIYLSSCIHFFNIHTRKFSAQIMIPLANLAVAVVLVYLHLPCWFPIRFGSTRVAVPAANAGGSASRFSAFTPWKWGPCVPSRTPPRGWKTLRSAPWGMS